VAGRRPLLAGTGQQVERAELVHGEHDRRVAPPGSGLALGDVVQLQDPVLLGLVVGAGRLLPGLYGLKGHLFLFEDLPEALMADVVDHPLGDQELGQLGQAPGRERQPVVNGSRQGDLFNLLTLGEAERRRPAADVPRVQGLKAVLVEVVEHLPYPVGAGEAHLGDPGHVHALDRYNSLRSQCWASKGLVGRPQAIARPRRSTLGALFAVLW
jgi:hypothetical protein